MVARIEHKGRHRAASPAVTDAQVWLLRIQLIESRPQHVERNMQAVRQMRGLKLAEQSNVEQPQREWVAHDAEFQMLFVLHGRVQLHRQEADCVELKEGDCVVVPAGMAHGLSGCSEDLQLLDVVLPSEGAELSVQVTPSGAKL